MKVFQILNGMCHWDATPAFPTLESTIGYFAPDILFIEAPVFVFEQWGFDETKEGNARFISPAIPEGWGYNFSTGTYFNLEPQQEPEPEPEPEETEQADMQTARTLLGVAPEGE